ncbi:unnamed protein product [Dracunculus medinensis]|uniref:RING-type domain-containing protein n=1 Tax=Dracunculus medinensis TaxID=318479 RepID=A0A0N4U7E6_DRAME|nr:unnamed protein product [Dracunculus medinensis]
MADHQFEQFEKCVYCKREIDNSSIFAIFQCGHLYHDACAMSFVNHVKVDVKCAADECAVKIHGRHPIRLFYTFDEEAFLENQKLKLSLKAAKDRYEKIRKQRNKLIIKSRHLKRKRSEKIFALFEKSREIEKMKDGSRGSGCLSKILVAQHQ